MPTMASDAMATPTGPSVLERATQILREIQSGDSKPARVALKSFSIVTGIFLIIAGIFGTTELFKSLLYFVGSLYAIIFGLVVLVIELYKLTDSLPTLIKTLSAPIKRVYDLIDIYLKFLTLQRGKGLFYCGVGVLVFFIGTGDGGWGLNNAAAMLLFIDGGIHTCAALSYRRPTPPHPTSRQSHGTNIVLVTGRVRVTTNSHPPNPNPKPDPYAHRLKLVKETGPAQVEGMAAVFPPVTEWEEMRAQASDLDGARVGGR